MARHQSHQEGRCRPAHGAASTGLWPTRLEQDPPDPATDGGISFDAGSDCRGGRNPVNPLNTRLRPGDLVEVKAPDEILQTLDVDGTLDRLPFMPEMIELCGKRFPVSRRVLKTCYTGLNLYDAMRRFRSDDVVTLDGVRCSGAAHDGCQKACLIFWRDAWLRKVEPPAVHSKVDPDGRERLRARLKTSTGPQTYFCQASELLNATVNVSRREQLRTCAREVRTGNRTIFGMAHGTATWLYRQIRRRPLGEYARGRSPSTPGGGLNLKAGEWVEV